ncbi:MAG: hypothetical protein JOY69_06715 [Candidatus Eremiobacteraeota bacterium]|nr:hypothetical protein [Candidatus Eremiobacteraeota bacterium]
MEPLDAAAAREHLEMVERILAQSQQRLCAGGEFFVVWGLFSGGATVAGHLISRGLAPVSLMWVVAAALVACIVFSIVRARALRGSGTRESLVQREFFNVLWLTLGLAFVVNIAGYRLFPGLASAAIWSFAEVIVLLYIGMHGNRRAIVCGMLVLASLIAANFVPPQTAAYVLAAGGIAGYTGFGLAELLSKE